VFITALSVVWVATYWALGLYLSAAIAFAYQVVAVVNLVVFARTRRYRFFRSCELALSLILPFVLQLSLGGSSRHAEGGRTDGRDPAPDRHRRRPRRGRGHRKEQAAATEQPESR